MRLYDIAEDYRAFMVALEAGEIPAEAIEDTLDGIEQAYEVKVDNIASLIKELSIEAAGIKAEADNLIKRAKAVQSRIDWLKDYLHRCMVKVGKPVVTSRNHVTICKTPPKCVIEDEELLKSSISSDIRYADCMDVELRTFIRKDELKKLLAAGEEIPGARLEQGERVNIRGLFKVKEEA